MPLQQSDSRQVPTAQPSSQMTRPPVLRESSRASGDTSRFLGEWFSEYYNNH